MPDKPDVPPYELTERHRSELIRLENQVLTSMGYYASRILRSITEAKEAEDLAAYLFALQEALHEQRSRYERLIEQVAQDAYQAGHTAGYTTMGEALGLLPKTGDQAPITH